MAKKKSSKQNATAPKEFTSSPFKDLKGLSAFTERKQASSHKPEEKAPVVDKVSVSSSVDLSFADEMDFLGVEPLEKSSLDVPAAKTVNVVPENEPINLAQQDHDKSVFLEALGDMEKTFVDEWPEEDTGKPAVPRRMKQVERGQLKPEAKLDLHGLTIAESSEKVRFFLQDALYQGVKTALIITGKGLHSNDGPVLRQAVEHLLNESQESVLEWGMAPRNYGGSGALIVFLRGA